MQQDNQLVMNKLFFIQSRDNIFRNTNYYDTPVSDSSKTISLLSELTASEVMMFNDFYNRLSHNIITDSMKGVLREVIDSQSTMTQKDIRSNAIIMSGILFGEKTRHYKHGVGAGIFKYH